MKHYKDENNQIFAYEEDGSQDNLVGDKTLLTDSELEILRRPTDDELIIQAKQYFTLEITKFIEDEVKVFNEANGVAFSSIANIDTASNINGYLLQEDCSIFVRWVYIIVWQNMRAWQSTLISIPTEEEFRAELNKYAR